MLYIQTLVRIADNSGGHFGLCVRILGQHYRGLIGDAVVISVKSILLNRKLTHQRKRKVVKGTVRRAIVLRNAFQKRRKFNIFIKGTTNTVAILGNWGMPLATRAHGPSYYELRISKFGKFSNITEGVL